jgi:hypothetical protein
MLVINIEDMSNRQLEDLLHKISVELQDREVRVRIDPECTNEEVFEDALTHGLTPEDASDPEWGLMYEEWLSERDRKISMRNTGA